MKNEFRGSTSYWMTTEDVRRFPQLGQSLDADVCIIGGGIGGLTTAYLLSREGKNVVVLEAWDIGSGETGRTTAHIAVPDDRFFEIEKMFGEEGARIVADSFGRATDLIEQIVRQENISCDFERLNGYLFSQTNEGQTDLSQELESARKAGVLVSRVDRVPGLAFDTGPCLEFHGQAQFHVLKYLNGLCDAILRNGGQIFSRTRAQDISGDDKVQVVTTASGQVRAAAVVVATNTPFNDRVVMHTKQAAFMTYVVGFRIPKNSVPRMLLWDTGDPYYYVRLATAKDEPADHDILIVGGQDNPVGKDEHPEHRYYEIEQWVRPRFRMTDGVAFTWCGEVMEPSDGVAYLGRNPADDRNVYVITGDSGNGMSHCTIGAMLITDMIMGRDNPWARLYDPARKAVHGIREFIKEQASTLARYSDWLTGGDVDSVDRIHPGKGAIVRSGRRKQAVYRDDDGELHAFSATCPHLGCVVDWNSAEKSWDCPCHGSRFNTEGQVLHGPANTPLQAIDPESGQRLENLPPDRKPNARFRSQHPDLYR